MMEQNNECSICHTEVQFDKLEEEWNMNLSLPKMMQERHLCFRCAFWEEKYQQDQQYLVQQVPDTTKWARYMLPLVTADHYWVSAEYNPRAHWYTPAFVKVLTKEYNIFKVHWKCKWLLDPEKTSYRILTTDGKLICTDHCSHQGEIPPLFFDKFKINAKFLNQTEAKEIIDLLSTKCRVFHHISDPDRDPSIIDFVLDEFSYRRLMDKEVCGFYQVMDQKILDKHFNF